MIPPAPSLVEIPEKLARALKQDGATPQGEWKTGPLVEIPEKLARALKLIPVIAWLSRPSFVEIPEKLARALKRHITKGLTLTIILLWKYLKSSLEH